MKHGTFNDVVNATIVNKTCNGNCSNCGECCSDLLPLDETEIYKIRQYIKKYNIKEQNHLPFGLSDTLDLTCPFRDNVNKKCTIYKVRPDICKCFICSKPKPDIEKDKALFYRTKRAVSMRNIFFKGPSYEQILILMLKQFKEEGV